MAAPPDAAATGDGVPLESAPASALATSPKALAYAMRTFAMACDQAAKIDSTARGSAITVDAPASTPACRRFWLQLARRRLGSKIVPSLFWTAGPSGRLLLALGAPPPALLGYLANPRHRATRFWPLRTDVATALDQALAALTPDQKRKVETPGTTLAQLAAAFS
jgi:hypothetical protein